MLETGDWLTPRLDTLVHPQKPPLLYWAVAFSLRTFGHSEAAARLPSAVALVGTCLITFLFSTRRFGRRTAWLALTILASAPYFITRQQVVTLDALLSLFFAAALCSFYLARIIHARYKRKTGEPSK